MAVTSRHQVAGMDTLYGNDSLDSFLGSQAKAGIRIIEFAGRGPYFWLGYRFFGEEAIVHSNFIDRKPYGNLVRGLPAILTEFMDSLGDNCPALLAGQCDGTRSPPIIGFA